MQTTGRARRIPWHTKLVIVLHAVNLKVTVTVTGHTGGTLNSIEWSSGVVKFSVRF